MSVNEEDIITEESQLPSLFDSICTSADVSLNSYGSAYTTSHTVLHGLTRPQDLSMEELGMMPIMTA